MDDIDEIAGKTRMIDACNPWSHRIYHAMYCTDSRYFRSCLIVDRMKAVSAVDSASITSCIQ